MSRFQPDAQTAAKEFVARIFSDFDEIDDRAAGPESESLSRDVSQLIPDLSPMSRLSIAEALAAPDTGSTRNLSSPISTLAMLKPPGQERAPSIPTPPDIDRVIPAPMSGSDSNSAGDEATVAGTHSAPESPWPWGLLGLALILVTAAGARALMSGNEEEGAEEPPAPVAPEQSIPEQINGVYAALSETMRMERARESRQIEKERLKWSIEQKRQEIESLKEVIQGMSEVLQKTVQLEQQAMGELGITDRRLAQARRQLQQDENQLQQDEEKLEQDKAKLAQAAQRLREARVELQQDTDARRQDQERLQEIEEEQRRRLEEANSLQRLVNEMYDKAGAAPAQRLGQLQRQYGDPLGAGTAPPEVRKEAEVLERSWVEADERVTKFAEAHQEALDEDLARFQEKEEEAREKLAEDQAEIAKDDEEVVDAAKDVNEAEYDVQVDEKNVRIDKENVAGDKASVKTLERHSAGLRNSIEAIQEL
jgi:hypothetical protein